jgi:thioredoxin reductase (NADPH)
MPDLLTSTETPDSAGAFPRIRDAQIEALAALGERRTTRAGEVLYSAGEVNCDFFVVLAGTVKLVEGHGSGYERRVSVHGHGRFLGGLGLFTGQAMLLTAVVEEPGEVLAVPAPRFREYMACDPELGDLILRAYLIRHSLLIGLGTGFRIIGSRFSPDTRRLREFAARNRLPHRWIDLEEDSQAEALLREFGLSPAETPVVIWRDGSCCAIRATPSSPA